ncbi:MAG: methyltransferase domain-containing protein [Candidatus Latescibacteria bacterium]|nr:methyltransferase domain-containing protein [Candidatus Latescibacterota bacterium]
MDHFATTAVASGYASDRPYFHPQVMAQVQSRLGLSGPCPRALDVGCGAGLSTLALTALAERVVGVDSSAAMVQSAIPHERVEYLTCAAEDLAFDEPFDLITLAGSINWIDRPRFFARAEKNLRPGGHLLVYDNTILGEMAEDPAFATWYQTVYLRRYPRPSRDESPLDAAEYRPYGFEFSAAEDYTNQVAFTRDRFIDYLLTQSNTTSVLEIGAEDYTEMRAWFTAALAPFFSQSQRTLLFGGYIWYLQKEAA